MGIVWIFCGRMFLMDSEMARPSKLKLGMLIEGIGETALVK